MASLPDAKKVLAATQAGQYSPIVDLGGKKVIIRDFTRGGDNEELKEGEFDIGKYNEMRLGMYETELFNDTKNTVQGFTGRRIIHIGVDIGGGVGTPVRSFYDGIVYKFGYNPAKGDYGHCIVVQYKINGTDVWGLYGHLSARSVQFKFEGKAVKKGEVIGWFGDRNENGDWPPHVHFQLSFIKPTTHDLPGVVSIDDHKMAEKQFPDPRLVLGPLYEGAGLILPPGFKIEGTQITAP